MSRPLVTRVQNAGRIASDPRYDPEPELSTGAPANGDEMRGGAIPHGDAGTLGAYEELERRLALATEADTVRGLSFHNVLDAVRMDLGSEGLAHLTGSREAPDFKSFFSYPVRDYLRLQYAAGWMLCLLYTSDAADE